MKIKKQSVVLLLRRIADDIEKNGGIDNFAVLTNDFSKTNWHAELPLITDCTTYECAIKFAPTNNDFVTTKAMQNIENETRPNSKKRQRNAA